MNVVPVLNLEKSKKATQSIFLVCGIGISSWAIMVPFAKDRLNLNDSSLGLLLLLLGAGALTMMPVTGILIHKFGSRIIMLIASLLIAIFLPLLLLMNSILAMGFLLFLFGAAIGTVDVAMNAHGVQVQNLYDKPIMSSLHGLFSVGGLVGPLGLGLLIKMGISPVIAVISISILLLLIAGTQYQFLLPGTYEKEVSKRFDSPTSTSGDNKIKIKRAWLNKSVLYLGLLCFALFLAEGAMLDWSAVFLKEDRGVNVAMAGMGYAAFSVAMAIMRLLGDRLVMRLDSKRVVIYGCLIAAAGLSLAVLTPWLITSLLGFVLLGIGAANTVPVFFSEGGSLKDVPASAAIPAISTFGYAGQLAGPALLGFISHHTSLPIALGFISFLLLLVGLSYSFRKSPEVQMSV